jgi:hypothetical protein
MYGKTDVSDIVASTNLRSPLDIVLDESIKRAKAFDDEIAHAKTKGEDLSAKAFKFKAAEIARLGNMGSLQEKLDDYRQKMSKLGLKDKENEANKSNNSTKLGNHLTAAGKFRSNQHFQAHHIVCSKHASHVASRFILFDKIMGYGINDPDNGCWLPTKHKYAQSTKFKNAVGHQYVHTTEYATWVKNTITGSTSKEVLKGRLLILQMKLINMTTQKAKEILTDKGQTDFRTKS